jgi:putative DNA primase/helicase
MSAAEAFEAFIRGLGLMPRGAVVADGRWHRCPCETNPRKKNGSWKLAADGGRGWAMDFMIHPQPLVWTPERGESPSPHFDAALLRRANAEARQRQVRATQAAREYHCECEPLIGVHPYLEAHGLDASGCYGLRVDRDGWLVVPMFRDRNLMSVQRIAPDGVKRFWPGAPASGASYTIERPQASITVLCEGLATGLAIYNAAPLTRVVVAFNSGNLSKVSVPYAGLLTIAADNDYGTEGRIGSNPGVLAAQEAADAHGGGIAVPVGIHGTDFCDWRMERTAERMERKRLHETRGDVRRAVDAELADIISRAARFRAPRVAP